MTEQQPDSDPRLKPTALPTKPLEHKPIMYDGGISALLSGQLLNDVSAHRDCEQD